MSPTAPTRTGPRKGVTLTEALLASVILAAAVLAIIWPFVAANQAQAQAIQKTHGAALAEELMEEILAKPFDDPQGSSTPGPEDGESDRSRFDNADDYHKYTEAAGQMQALDGSAIRGTWVDGLSRSVTAQYVYLDGQDTTQPPSVLRVIVRVRRGGDELAVLTRLIYDCP